MEMIVIVSAKSIEQTINDFINYCIFEKGLSDKTKESYYNDLNIYKEYLNNKKSLYEIESRTLLEVKLYQKKINKNSKIKKYLIYNPYKLYNITKLRGVYNVYYISLTINGVNIDANIIKTKKGNTDATYTIVAYFKEGTYISQNKNIASICAIKHWARYLSWHYYSKEERAEIRKNIYNIKELNETLKDLVWNFECSILGNNLKVYIVKS